MNGPIGVFDSGYGGLTILRELQKALPSADFLYLGDNARAPYGTRSFDLVYNFTRQAVRHLFDAGCPLVILACNTASAKALRTIQQRDLPTWDDPSRRVLGVIRPTVEALGVTTHSGHIGLVGTPGTIASDSYTIEVAKLFPQFTVHAHACPMWVPLVEYREADSDGADYFIRKDLDILFSKHPDIDTLVLGCTHYPLLIDKIRRYIPENITILIQGEIVAESLVDYLRRHPEMDSRISRGGNTTYLTTERADRFDTIASHFLNRPVKSVRTVL